MIQYKCSNLQVNKWVREWEKSTIHNNMISFNNLQMDNMIFTHMIIKIKRTLMTIKCKIRGLLSSFKDKFNKNSKFLLLIKYTLFLDLKLHQLWISSVVVKNKKIIKKTSLRNLHLNWRILNLIHLIKNSIKKISKPKSFKKTQNLKKIYLT